MADYTYFMFDGVSSSKYNLYIQNNGEDLSYPSQPGFENQIVSPLYQGTNYLAGVNKKERTFSFNCWADSLNRDSVRAMLDWLSPDKVSELVLSYNPNYYYKAKLASVTDFKHMAINGDETSNYEFQLTFVTIGDFAAISRTDFVINTKANPVNTNEALFLNPDNLAPTAIWDSTTSKFKLFNYASEPMYLTTKINGTTQFTIDKNDVAQYAYSKTAAADFVADSKYGFVKIGNNLAETYSDVTATTNLGAMSIESGRPETLYTTINGTPGATVTLNYTDHILKNTDTTNLYMIIQDGDYGMELLTQEMTEAERQLYITESINEQYNKINRDGSNSEIINLSFLGGANLSYVSDRQILQYTNPDGTTNDIGGEVWFSEGKAAEFIPNGSPVQFAGAQGGHYLFKIAVPSEINANPTLFMGVATSDIARNAWGKVTHFGVVHDFNTNGWAQGTVLWFDSTNGGLTTTEPVAPKAKIQVAAVVRAHPTAGSILVRTNFMPRLSQDSDTLITNPQDGDILVYSSANGRWENNDILNSKADKLYATNLVTNGDFSNGTTGWSNAGSGLVWYVSNNEAIITNLGTGPTYKLYQLLTATIGNVYYGRFYLSSNSSSDGIMVASSTTKYHSGSGNYEPLSIRHTASVTSTDFRLYSSRTGDISENPIKIKYALLLNLTSIFGAGNEPTATEMDTLLAKFPNSWFDGTAYLADLSEIVKLGNSTIQNETEANAKVEALATGVVVTKNTVGTDVALTVNQKLGTGKIASFQFNGTEKARVGYDGKMLAIGDITSFSGSFISPNGLINYTSSNNAYINVADSGTRISRNTADANPALKVNQANASSTGNIAEFQFNGTTKLAIDKNGLLPATNVTNTPSGNISAVTVQAAINELDTEKVSIAPIATYTHSGNREVYVSAIDVDTNTFTSVAHGLANGDTVYPVFEDDLGTVYASTVLPGGMQALKTYPGYYVVNKTNDTFQLSQTNGGAAIDITANASLDLTKWHFEDGFGTETITISGLPSGLRRIRVVQRGRAKRPLSPGHIGINNVDPQTNSWLHANSIGLPVNALTGNIYHNVETIIDTKGLLYVRSIGVKFDNNTISANIGGEIRIHQVCYTPSVCNVDISSIGIYNIGLANGATIEVYRL